MFNEDIIKQYFKKKNIPYNKIDNGMIRLIYVFNKIGMKTEFCCTGHGKQYPYIIFNESVKDCLFYNFIDKVINIDDGYQNELSMWFRKNRRNWIYRYNLLFEKDEHLMDFNLNCMAEYIAEIYNIKE